MGNQFLKLVNNAQLYRTVIKKKKKSKRTKYERKKTDHYTYRQHGIYLQLRELFAVGIDRDFKKCKQWWDFAIPEFKIAIKIKCSNTRYNVEPLERMGWRVLFINFMDSQGTSMEHLIKEIKFVLDKPKFIEKCAERLNNNLPRSEEWLLDKISKEWFFKKLRFEHNVPMFGQYIYDLFSSKYRLCIEVDGKIHEEADQIEKDFKKDQGTISRGFHIIRIKAFDNMSYNSAVLLIEQVIKNFKAKKFKVEQQKEFNEKIIELNKSGKLGF